MKFIKRPIIIEAVQFNGFENMKEIGDLWRDAPLDPKQTYDPVVQCPISFSNPALCRPECYIDTLEGRMTAMPGDWIIKGVKGELYPCKPDIFAATYDPLVAPEMLDDSKDCEVCAGTGLRIWGDSAGECRYCDGTGKNKEAREQ